MKRLLPLLLLLMPLPAFCLDMDFYTYDGFQETVDAFTRLALIFSDAGFAGFAFTFGLVGIVMGAVMFATKAHMGQASAPLAWVIPIIFGMVIYQGLIIPTGTIYIYDDVLNANQAVGGVPDIIVFVAGGLNELERDIVQVIDTGSANPYDSTGGMESFNLIMSAAGSQPDDLDLGRSVQQYYKDCGVWAVGTNYGGVSLQELMRNTSDLTTTFAKFANPALSTTYYTSANDQGAVETCAAAWSAINTAITSASEMQSMESEICQKSGFDPTVATELTACDTGLGNVGSNFGVTGANSGSVMRSMFLAQSVQTALQSGDFALGQSEIMNRQVMTESLGSADAMNEWIPKLRAFMTATVLGLIPLLALFMMTPLSMKALAVVIGLFMWLFFWGIADATASIMANDAAVNAFAQITHYQLGFDAIMNAPEGAVKALGIFGKSRCMAMGLATLLSGSLMHFGGVALSSISRNLQSDLEGKGERSASTAILPEQRGQYLNSLAADVGTEGAMKRYGFGNVARGNASGTYQGAAAAQSYVNNELAGGMGFAPAMDGQGQAQAGQTIGQRETFTAAGMTPLQGGRAQGSSGAAQTAVSAEIARNVSHGESSPEAFIRGSELSSGSTLAQSDVTPDPESYRQQQRVMARKTLAASDKMGSEPGLPEFLGATGVTSEKLQDLGLVDAVGAFGEDGVRRGNAFAVEGSAARGEAAAGLGGTARVARETGNASVAQDLAAAEVGKAAVQSMGLNPNNLRNLETGYNKRGRAAVSFAVDDANRDPVLKGMLASGQIDQNQYAEMANNKWTGTYHGVIGEDGKFLGGSIDTGTSTNRRVMNTSVVGSDKTTIQSTQDINRDSTVFDRSFSAVGGTGIVATKGATADIIIKGTDRYGNVQAPYKNQVVETYVSALGEYAHRLGADSVRAYDSQVASQVSGELGLHVPGIGGVGTTASSTESRSDGSSSRTSTDVGNVFFRSVFDTAHAEGQKQAARIYGANYQGSASAQEANAYVAKFTEEKLQGALNLVRASADQQSGLAVNSNSTVKGVPK